MACASHRVSLISVLALHNDTGTTSSANVLYDDTERSRSQYILTLNRGFDVDTDTCIRGMSSESEQFPPFTTTEAVLLAMHWGWTVGYFLISAGYSPCSLLFAQILT